MTRDELADALLQAGAKEYTNRLQSEETRSFYFGSLKDVPACLHNEKSPSLHLYLYPDISVNERTVEGGVEVEVFGAAGENYWFRALVYTIRREDLLATLPQLERTASAVWSAFVASVSPAETERTLAWT